MVKELIPRPLPAKARLHLALEENANLRTRIAALEAQLAARTGGVKVKALEWKRSATKYGWLHETTTPFGLEIVYEVLHEGINRVAYACWIEDYFQSAKEAKAAVQADYERRILSALSPAPEAQQEPHEVVHIYEGDGGVVVREIGNISTFGTLTPAVHAAFEAASDAEAQEGAE